MRRLNPKNRSKKEARPPTSEVVRLRCLSCIGIIRSCLEGTGADEAGDVGRAESEGSTTCRHRDNPCHCVRPWIQTTKWRIEFPRRELAGLTKPAMSFSAFKL